MSYAQDLTLPKSIITRLAKGVLPPNTQIQTNAILAMSKSATIFISHLANAYVSVFFLSFSISYIYVYVNILPSRIHSVWYSTMRLYANGPRPWLTNEQCERTYSE